MLNWVLGKAVVKRAKIRHLHHLYQFASRDLPLVNFFFCRQRVELLINHSEDEYLVNGLIVDLAFLVYSTSTQVRHPSESYDVGMYDWHLHKVVVITHVHESLA